ncbi:hypothetical protein F4861DRAFT_90286 [Xylaria intraflava]|nr:hypothetical protein F4861DRAFT_90286 [Xylaria intraflava]
MRLLLSVRFESVRRWASSLLSSLWIPPSGQHKSHIIGVNRWSDLYLASAIMGGTPCSQFFVENIQVTWTLLRRWAFRAWEGLLATPRSPAKGYERFRLTIPNLSRIGDTRHCAGIGSHYLLKMGGGRSVLTPRMGFSPRPGWRSCAWIRKFVQQQGVSPSLKTTPIFTRGLAYGKHFVSPAQYPPVPECCQSLSLEKGDALIRFARL